MDYMAELATTSQVKSKLWLYWPECEIIIIQRLALSWGALSKVGKVCIEPGGPSGRRLTPVFAAWSD